MDRIGPHSFFCVLFVVFGTHTFSTYYPVLHGIFERSVLLILSVLFFSYQEISPFAMFILGLGGVFFFFFTNAYIYIHLGGLFLMIIRWLFTELFWKIFFSYFNHSVGLKLPLECGYYDCMHDPI